MRNPTSDPIEPSTREMVAKRGLPIPRQKPGTSFLALARLALCLIITLSVFALNLSACSLITLPGGQPQEPTSDNPIDKPSSGDPPIALPAGALRVHFIDVGQGDSILIEFPGGQNMLIDAGPQSSWPNLVSYLRRFQVKRLDWVLFTHPHEDHIGCGAKVIESFEIGKVYMSKTSHTTDTYENLLNAIDKKGLKITAPKAGMRIGPEAAKPSATEITMKVLGPLKSYSDLNNSSIVAALTFGKVTFLFTGDAEAQAEKDMLQEGAVPSADVLKVGHHGSDSSTTPAFLAKVKPTVAVISVGKDNDYHHPSKTVLTKLRKSGAKVYRLDISGSVVVTVKDGKFEVKTKR